MFEGVSTLKELCNELQVFEIKKEFLFEKPKVETLIWEKIQTLLNNMLVVDTEQRWDAWSCLSYLNTP